MTTPDLPASGGMRERARGAVSELAELIERLDEDQATAAVAAIVAAERVFFTGLGRSGLVARALAMRLMHTGLTAHVVGEIATPAIRPGDLLVALSARGSGALVDQAAKAGRAGARVLAVTARPDGPLAELSDPVLLVPARSGVATGQHAGSLFEQGCLVIGDALCAAVRARLRVPESDLDARHANLP